MNRLITLLDKSILENIIKIKIYSINYPKYLLKLPKEPESYECCNDDCVNCVYYIYDQKIDKIKNFINDNSDYIILNKDNLFTHNLKIYNEFIKI